MMMNTDNRDWLAWVLVGTAIGVAWFALEAQKPPNAKLADA
jgi:hypothetical protein